MKKTLMKCLVITILALFFVGAFASAEFPWTTSLTVKNSATSAWTTATANTGFYSVHLKTTGTPTSGDEARYVVTLPSGITLGDIYTISWQELLIAGYPPHVDIILDIDGDTVADDAIVFEYAYNTMTHYGEAPMPYGAKTGFWYPTFGDDGNGPSQLTQLNSYGWLSSGPSGPPASLIAGTLLQWQMGTVSTGIDATTDVLRLEFEIDNWVVQSEAYLDDVEINGLDIMGVFGPTGPQGPMGPQGYIGPQGPQGDTGATGPQGDTGETGLQGPPGADGVDGEKGDAGLPGSDGKDGINGTDGATGPEGPKGDTGATGPRGSTGSRGATGLQGSQGEVGEPGLDGLDGVDGIMGLQGVTGDAGETGDQGSIGSTGPQGETGERGSQGETGEEGQQGETGPEGPQGEVGAVTFAYVGAAFGGISLLGLIAQYLTKK